MRVSKLFLFCMNYPFKQQSLTLYATYTVRHKKHANYWKMYIWRAKTSSTLISPCCHLNIDKHSCSFSYRLFNSDGQGFSTGSTGKQETLHPLLPVG